MNEQTATIKHQDLVLCAKHNGALYQVHSKSINITKTLNDDRLLAIVDLDGEVVLIATPICGIEEYLRWLI